MENIELDVSKDNGNVVKLTEDDQILQLSYAQKEKLWDCVADKEYFEEQNISFEDISNRTWIMQQNEFDRDYAVLILDDETNYPDFCLTSYEQEDADYLIDFLGIEKSMLPKSKEFEPDLEDLKDIEDELQQIREDTNLDLEPANSPQNIYDLYDEIGKDVFSEGNISALKASGNIDATTGMPMNFDYEHDSEPQIMSFEELYNLDYSFIELPYIKNLILNEFKRTFPDGLKITIEPDDLVSDDRDMSTEFLRDCMNEDVFEYFSNYETYSFVDIDDNVDDIDDKCKKLLEQIGFPYDIYNQLKDGTEDEEHPLAEYYDDLKGYFEKAVNDGEIYGAEAECLDDFNRAFEYVGNSDEITFLGRDENFDYHAASYNIKDKFVENHIEDIWINLAEYSERLNLAIEKTFKDYFNDNFNFNEPYAGWCDFNKECMNDSLYDGLLELKSSIMKNENSKRFGEDKLLFLDDDGNIIPNNQSVDIES